MAEDTSLTILDFLPKLEKALAYAGNTHTVEDVVSALLAGEAQWWIQGRGMVVTRIEQTPQVRTLLYWLAAGDLEDVLALEPRIEAWARQVGCTRAVWTGRRGWTRVLKDQGWRDSRLTTMTKSL